jgi:uncharacterized alkaline shock family protein YloU
VDDKKTFKITGNDQIGEVHIANEVVAIIAGLAATEVEGVAAMAGDITSELISKLGMKSLSKGVKVEVGQDDVSIELALVLEYGYNVPSVSITVQERVMTAVETMTGLSVTDVNIKIADVNLDKK